MPRYQMEFGGKTMELEAPTPEAASVAARLYFAGRGRADQVAAGRFEDGQAALAARPNSQQTRPQLEQNLQAIDPRLAGGANNEELTPDALASGAAMTATMLMPASRLVGAGVGGYEGYQRHGLPGAVGGAAMGAFAPEIASKAGAPLLRALLGGRGGTVAGALRGLIGEAEAVTPAVESGAAKAAGSELTAYQREHLALRKRALDLKEQQLSMRAGRDAAKKAGVSSTSSTVEPPAATTTTPVAPPEPAAAPTRAVTRSVVPKPSAPAVEDADIQRQVLKIQQAMSQPGVDRAAIKAWIAQQPPDVAEQITSALARRQAKQATIHGALFDPSKPGPSGGIGEELARLLGQLQ